MARRRASATLQPIAQGQRAGRWSLQRRAERVSRPGRLKSCRRSVLVVTMPSPRPIRAVQRARLWAVTWIASQAPLAANLRDGRWLRPTPYLRSMSIAASLLVSKSMLGCRLHRKRVTVCSTLRPNCAQDSLNPSGRRATRCGARRASRHRANRHNDGSPAARKGCGQGSVGARTRRPRWQGKIGRRYGEGRAVSIATPAWCGG